MSTYTRALVIGNNYSNTQYALHGCIDDAKRFQTFLSQQCSDAELHFVTEADKNRMIQELTWLTSNLPTDKPVVLVFYFSGHGSITATPEHEDSDTGEAEIIITYDLQGLFDYEISKFLDTLPGNVTMNFISDSCHSGTICNLTWEWYSGTTVMSQPFRYRNNTITQPISVPLYQKIFHSTVPRYLAKIWSISGCKDNQTSEEGKVDGVIKGYLTAGFIASYKQGITPRNLLFSIQQWIGNRSPQIPQLCSTTDTMIDDAIVW